MYSTNLTNSQWQVIENILNDKRKRKYDLRNVVNAILYLLKTGCQWRMLPGDFPPYRTVFYYFRRWITKGIWKKLNHALNMLFRQQSGREASPSVGIMDSQSIKNSERGVCDKGYDGNKKINGRKRHIIVDTLGLLLGVKVHAANIHDSKGAFELVDEFDGQTYARMRKIIADKAYRGELVDYCEAKNIELEIAPGLKGAKASFEVIPQRWKVERSISWFQWDRRLSRDFEAETSSSEAFAFIFNIKRIIRNF
jgi:putative transposase